MLVERARLAGARVHEEDAARRAWRPLPELDQEPTRGRVGPRVDQPLVAGVRGEDPRDLGREGRLELALRRPRQRPHGTVDDRPPREGERRAGGEDPHAVGLKPEALREHRALAEVGRGQDGQLGRVEEDGARHRRHRQRQELEGTARLGGVAHDPLRVRRLEEEADPVEGCLDLELLGRRREVGERGVVEGPLQALEPALEALHLGAEEGPIRLAVREPGQRRPEPAPHLVRRERHREHLGELGLEGVGLVDDEEPAPREVGTVPLAERGEVGRVGAEDRRRQRRRLGPRVGALAPRAPGPAASPVERRDPHLGRVELARVVVAALDQVELGAEQALVLVLEKLLRGEEVRVAAPAGEGHGDVALAEARRRLDEDHALRHLEQALEVVEEAPLL
ncbi:MAG: hypothetical protein DME17_18995, partial [Candidatus Rokuibacteriota bacterium]